jgi:5-oxoprolinase (ATP-hydrolysing) subunit A
MLLNLDAGEHDDEPEELWALADILAVACGGHAGDAHSMKRLAAFVARSPRRTALGAHPSYPDRDNFGRASMDIDPTQLQAHVASQCRALADEARAHGIAVHYVKPHGALYHDCTKHRLLANAVIDGALTGLLGDTLDEDEDDGVFVGSAIDDGSLGARANAAALDAADRARSSLTFIGPPTGCLADAARIRGLTYLREGFADRATRPDGSLVPRSEPNALIKDPIAAASRARQLIGSVDTICVHGDSPGALEIARAVRTILSRPL